MSIQAVLGKDMQEDFIKDVEYLDSIVFPKELCGTYSSDRKRYLKDKDSYILLRESDTLVGYINFFPVSTHLYNHILTSSEIMDDNIIPDDIYLYSKEEPNRLYILSVVISPEYQNSNAVNVLANAFIVFLRDKENTGYPIERLLVSCISEDGSKLFSRLRFRYEKQLDDNYCLYTCEGSNLKDLLQKGCVRRMTLSV